MITSFIVLFLAIFSCSCNAEFLNLTDLAKDDLSIDCEFPLKFHPFDVQIEPQGHPYQNVNLNRNFTLDDFLRKDLGDKMSYKIKRALGSGTFGSVFKAVHLPTQDNVALKMIVHAQEAKITKEVAILKELDDAPNFLSIRDVLREEEDEHVTIGLVLDFFKAQKFEKFYETLDAHQVKVMIFQTMKTVEYAHSRGIMHRDIKPLNVLMEPETLEVKVIDWGQADYYVPGKNFSINVGTLYYQPPELFLGYPFYDYSLDIWSTGCMLAEMAFKKVHFFKLDRTMFPKNENYTKKEDKIVAMRGQLDAYARVVGTENLKAYAEKFKEDMVLDILDYVGDYKGEPITSFITEDNADMIDPLLIDLLSKMLVIDHTQRITMKEALSHPYFDEIREEYGSS